MKQHQAATVGAIVVFAGLLGMQGPVAARGSFATENIWAAEHVDALPADIRREISKLERVCGTKASATHYFAVSIEAGGQRFISLHFEDFACGNRAAVCNADSCLHEVFAESQGHHRLVFSTNARDLRMTKAGDIASFEVTRGASKELFRWNGRSFVPAGTVRNGL
jgi:hypothetical protein